MDEPMVAELMRRVEHLEQEKRRWKWIALGALLLLIVMTFGGGAVLVGTASLFTFRIHEARMQELEARDRAEMEAVWAERAALEAQLQEEKARQMQKELDRK